MFLAIRRGCWTSVENEAPTPEEGETISVIAFTFLLGELGRLYWIRSKPSLLDGCSRDPVLQSNAGGPRAALVPQFRATKGLHTTSDVCAGSDTMNSTCIKACSAFGNKAPIARGFEEVTQQATAGEGKSGAVKGEVSPASE